MKKICAIHQPHYLPWLRYFDKIARADVFVLLDDAQFNKNGWQNRNKLKGPAGWFYLTVPVCHGHIRPIREVPIDNRGKWAARHWRSMEVHYRKAPCFDRYAREISGFYARPWEKLADLSTAMLEFFLASLDIRTPVLRSSALDLPGGGTERLARICRAVGATHYLTGAYAVDAYLEVGTLKREGLEVAFQQWEAPTYRQRYPDVPFIPDLSIVDLLLNHGPLSRGILLREGPRVEET